jgi:hypothetical protein
VQKIELPEPSADIPARVEELRRPARRCAGCLTWPDQLIYLSNGQDYCVPCARRLYAAHGWVPAGTRNEDDAAKLEFAETLRSGGRISVSETQGEGRGCANL